MRRVCVLQVRFNYPVPPHDRSEDREVPIYLIASFAVFLTMRPHVVVHFLQRGMEAATVKRPAAQRAGSGVITVYRGRLPISLWITMRCSLCIDGSGAPLIAPLHLRPTRMFERDRRIRVVPQALVALSQKLCPRNVLLSLVVPQTLFAKA